MPEGTATRFAVTALLVVQHGRDRWLSTTFSQLIAQTRRPDRLVIIDATEQRLMHGYLDEHDDIRAHFPHVSVVTVPAGSPFADLVDIAVEALPGPGEDVVVPRRTRERAHKRPVRQRDRYEWLWLLHEDSAPDREALARLVTVVEPSSRIGIAGCKVVSFADPKRLLNVGLELTRTGRHVGARTAGERDQGQYDQRTDVLAVSSAGMLIRRDVYAVLGGFDPAFDGDGDGVDICWRAHLTGHQVVVVPGARVRQDLADPADPAARDADLPRPRSARTLRRHRQVALARSSLLGMPFMAAWIFVCGIASGLLLLLAKRPRRAGAEFAQAFAPFDLGRIAGARFRFVGRATARRRHLGAVFVPWEGAVRSAYDAIHDAVTPDRDGDDPAGEDVEPGPVSEEVEELRPPRRAGLITNPGLWAVLALVVAAGWRWRDLLGGGAVQGRAQGLGGGELRPFATTAQAMYHSWRDTWSGPGLGGLGRPAESLIALMPFAWLIEQIPGLRADTSGATAVAWLLVLAMPLSGWTAYRAGRIATAARWPRAVAALAWASLPTLTTGIAQGRLGPVIAHILLPLVVAGGFGIASRRATASVTFGTTLAAGLLGAFAPAMLLLALVPALLVLGAGPGWARLRALILLVVPWLLLGVSTLWLTDDWHRIFSGPGVLTAGSGAPVAPWQLALLHPGGPGSYLVLVSAPVLLVAVLGLLRGGTPRAHLGLIVFGLISLAAALLAPRVTVVPGRTVWTGLPLDGWALALLGCALLGLRGVRVRTGWQRTVVPVVVSLAGLAAVTGAVFAAGSSLSPLHAAPATMPAVAAEQARTPGAVRALILRAGSDGAITYRLQGRETGLPGTDIGEPLSAVHPALTSLVSTILSGQGTTGAPARLHALAVGYVVLEGPPSATAPLRRTLDATAGLVPTSGTTGLWRVSPLASPDGRTSVASSRLTISVGGVPTREVPSSVQHARTRTQLPAGAPGRRLVVSEGAGWAGANQVRYAGRTLTAVPGQPFPTYLLGAGPGTLEITPQAAHPRVRWAQGIALALVVFFAIPLGNRRSRRSQW
ncbi:glycosyltransferase [Calidifontibacter sp. DB0510]|uniref:Glycosyltransferase n=1 Tax=Metallococcus carri TaxID=1656884 RepID=A0A967AY44_9MICO|nr:glycosyltransferase [Metallococcus carri]NHN54577.1 glycosyltransferase [Metallococcus carri]NOP36584.1 glycosyltransferase [Calidifontibacter sp. DB2511S]